MYRIYIVEDDDALRQELIALLERWQFEPIACTDYADVCGECLGLKPHLVIMDVNLPRLDGFFWCARIRQTSDVPMLFLSARDSDQDAVRAMEGGGDDYLTKPFAPAVLISKINALVRRAYEYKPQEQGVLRTKRATLDLSAAALIVGDARLELSKNELKLMACLMERKGEPVTRDQFMRILWDDDIYVNDNSLTVNINRLRKRLGEVGLTDFIVTRKGVGYYILDP